MTNQQKMLVASMMVASLLLGLSLAPLLPAFGAVLVINALCCAIVLIFGSGEPGR